MLIVCGVYFFWGEFVFFVGFFFFLGGEVSCGFVFGVFFYFCCLFL